MKNNNETEVVIFKSIKISVAIILISSLMGTLIISFFNPLFVAKTTSNLGMSKLSLLFYERAYNKREDDISILYEIINKSYYLGLDSKVVDGFEVMYNDGDLLYNEFIQDLHENYLEQVLDINMLLLLLNEDKRLKRMYANSLFSLNEHKKLLDFIVSDFMNEFDNQIDLYSQRNFLLSIHINNLIKAGEISKIYDLEDYEYNSQNLNVIDKIYSFYNNLDLYFSENIFNEDYELFSNAELFYSIMFTNQLVLITESILSLINSENPGDIFNQNEIQSNYENYQLITQLKNEYNQRLAS